MTHTCIGTKGNGEPCTRKVALKGTGCYQHKNKKQLEKLENKKKMVEYTMRKEKPDHAQLYVENSSESDDFKFSGTTASFDGELYLDTTLITTSGGETTKKSGLLRKFIKWITRK